MCLEANCSNASAPARVSPGSPLAPRFGWYISNNSYTQTDQIMDHWRSFQRVDVVRIFELTQEEDATLQRDYTKSGDKYSLIYSFRLLFFFSYLLRRQMAPRIETEK